MIILVAYKGCVGGSYLLEFQLSYLQAGKSYNSIPVAQ